MYVVRFVGNILKQLQMELSSHGQPQQFEKILLKNKFDPTRLIYIYCNRKIQGKRSAMAGSYQLLTVSLVSPFGQSCHLDFLLRNNVVRWCLPQLASLAFMIIIDQAINIFETYNNLLSLGRKKKKKKKGARGGKIPYSSTMII